MTASDQMIAKYGLPDGNFQAKFCTLWYVQKDFPWFPTTRIFLLADFKEMLYKSFQAVEQAALEDQIKVFSGCLVIRNVRGRSSYSAHAWGAAIDINASEEPMVIKPADQITDADRLGKWDPKFIEAMCSSGIHYGGYFHDRPDPMHFAMLNM